MLALRDAYHSLQNISSDLGQVSATHVFHRIESSASIVSGTCAEWKAFWSEGASGMSTSLSARTEAALFSSTSHSLDGDTLPESHLCGNRSVVTDVINALQNGASTSVLDCKDSTWRVANCAGEAMICSAGLENSMDCADDDSTVCKLALSGSLPSLWFAPCVSSTSHGSTKTADMKYDTGTLGILGFGFIDPFPAPKILNTTFESVSRNEVVARILVNGSAPGATGSSLYCGLFDNAEVAAIKADVTRAPSTVIMSKRRMTWLHQKVSASSDAELLGRFTFSDLVPATPYTILCTTKSPLGSALTTEDIWTHAISTRTQCCKEVLVRQFVRNATVGRISQGVLGVTVFHAPSVEPLLLTVSATSQENLALLEHFSPAETYLTRAAIAPGKQIEVMHRFYSGTEGDFHIDIALQGEAKQEYLLTWVGDTSLRSIHTSYDFVEPSVPRVESASFSSDGAVVSVVFDSPTDSGGSLLASSFPCSQLFDFAGVDDAWCRWSPDGRSIAIERAAHLVPGGTLSCRPDIVRAKCSLDGSEGAIAMPCRAWATMSRRTLQVSLPLSVHAPLFTINTAPLMLGADDLLTVDIATAVNNGGRPWKSIVLSLELRDNGTVVAIPSTLQEALYTESVTILPKTLFESGQTYIVSVTLCNFMGACNTESTTVTKKEVYSVPVVHIAGSRVIDMFVNQELSLQGGAFVYDHQGVKSRGGGMGYEWQVLADGVPLPALKSVSKLPSTLRLPKYTFKAGKTYTVILIAYRLDVPNVRGYNEVMLRVEHSALVPVIFGGNERYLRPDENDFFIDATSSYDMDDKPGSVPNSNLKFQWSCQLLKPYFAKDCADTGLRNGIKYKKSGLQSASLNVWFVATEEMSSANTTSEFTLRVYDATTNREATSSVIVIGATLASPSVMVYRGGDDVNNKISTSSTKVNVNQRMLFQGDIEHSVDAVLTWSSTPSLAEHAYLTSKSLSTNLATTQTFTTNVPLLIAAESLLERTTYTFTLTCTQITGEKASSSLSITTNGPPLPGRFDVSPVIGMEFDTFFKLVLQNWADEDIPILYSFGYTSGNSGQVLSVRAQSESPSAQTKLPAGSWNGTARSIRCVATIYDGLGANTTATQYVVVDIMAAESESKRVEALDAHLDTHLASVLQDTGDVSSNLEEARQLVTTLASALNAPSVSKANVDCSEVSDAFCALRNRHSCTEGDTANTCGNCLSDAYAGTFGASNDDCVDLLFLAPLVVDESTATPTEAPTLVNNFPSPKPTHNSGPTGPTPLPSGAPVRTPTLFPTSTPTLTHEPTVLPLPDLTAFFEQPKACPHNCFGRGVCKGVDVLSGDVIPISNCTMQDSTCDATCVCNDGYTGASCSLTTDELLERQIVREKLVVHLSNVSVFEDDTDVQVSIRLGSLAAITQVPDEMSEKSKVVALDMLKQTIESISASMDNTRSTEIPISSEHVDNVLGVMDRLVLPSMFISSVPSASSSPTRRHLRRHLGGDEEKGEDEEHEEGGHGQGEGDETPIITKNDFLEKVKGISALASKIAAHEAVLGELSPREHLYTVIKMKTRAGVTEDDLAVTVPLPALARYQGVVSSSATINRLAGGGKKKLLMASAMELDARLYDIPGQLRVSPQLTSQPLHLRLEHDASICTRGSPFKDDFRVRFVVKHRVPVVLTSENQGPTRTIRCYPGEVNVTKLIDNPCSAAHQQSITCNGTGVVFAIECPLKKETACSVPPVFLGNGIGYSGLEKLDVCSAIAHDTLTTTCECSLCGLIDGVARRRQLQGEEKVDLEGESTLEIVAMSEYVLYDFVNAVEGIASLDEAALIKADLVLVFFSFVVGFTVICLVMADFLHRYEKADFEEKKLKMQQHMSTMFMDTTSTPLNSVDDDSDEGSGKSKTRPPMLTKALSVMSSRNVNHAVAPGRIDGSSNLGAFATKEEISLGKMVEYVSSFFPGTFSNHRLSDRFWTELMNHQMIFLVFSSVSFFDRGVSALDLLTTSCVSAFLIALLLDLQYPSDDGTCSSFLSLDACESKRSMFNSDESMCSWAPEQPGSSIHYCYWVEPKSSISTLVNVVLVVIVITGPCFSLVDMVFEKILRAPSPEKANEAVEMGIHLKKFLGGFSDKKASTSIPTMSQSGSRAMRRHGVLVANEAVNEVNVNENGHDDCPQVEGAHLLGGIATTYDRNLGQSRVYPFTEKAEQISTGLQSDSLADSCSAVLQQRRTKRESTLQQLDITLNLPTEFDIAYRFAFEFAVDRILSTREIVKELEAAQKHRNERTSRRLQSEKLRADDSFGMHACQTDHYSDGTRVLSDPEGYLKSAFTVLVDVDVSSCMKYLNKDDHNDLTTVHHMLQNLETELLEQRKLISEKHNGELNSTKLAEFDSQWGIQKDGSEGLLNTAAMDKRYIGRKVGHALFRAKRAIAEMITLTDFHAGSRLIMLFVEDMLGTDSSHAGTFKRKHESDFSSCRAINIEVKLVVIAVIVLLNVFLILTCLAFGADKGKAWKETWVLIAGIKVFFDVFIKRFMVSVVLGFSVPSLISSDVRIIKSSLKKQGARLLRSKGSPFRFKRFSASDYCFASSLVAMQFPHLIESKLILAYRCVFPEPIVRDRENRLWLRQSGRGGSGNQLLQMILIVLMGMLLRFGSLDPDLQKLIVHVVPSFLLVAATYVCIFLGNSSSFWIFVSMVAMVSVGPKVYRKLIGALKECRFYIYRLHSLGLVAFVRTYCNNDHDRRRKSQRHLDLRKVADEESTLEYAHRVLKDDVKMLAALEFSDCSDESDGDEGASEEHVGDYSAPANESSACSESSSVPPSRDALHVERLKSQANFEIRMHRQSMALRKEKQRQALADRLANRNKTKSKVDKNASNTISNTIFKNKSTSSSSSRVSWSRSRSSSSSSDCCDGDGSINTSVDIRRVVHRRKSSLSFRKGVKNQVRKFSLGTTQGLRAVIKKSMESGSDLDNQHALQRERERLNLEKRLKSREAYLKFAASSSASSDEDGVVEVPTTHVVEHRPVNDSDDAASYIASSVDDNVCVAPLDVQPRKSKQGISLVRDDEPSPRTVRKKRKRKKTPKTNSKRFGSSETLSSGRGSRENTVVVRAVKRKKKKSKPITSPVIEIDALTLSDTDDDASVTHEGEAIDTHEIDERTKQILEFSIDALKTHKKDVAYFARKWHTKSKKT